MEKLEPKTIRYLTALVSIECAYVRVCIRSPDLHSIESQGLTKDQEEDKIPRVTDKRWNSQKSCLAQWIRREGEQESFCILTQSSH